LATLQNGAHEHRHTVVATAADADVMKQNTNMETNSTAADAALAVWLEMWNTDSEIARRICNDDFRIHFLNSAEDGSNPGDDVLGAESFARFLDGWREQHPDVVFTEVTRAVDGAHGRMLWNMQVGEVAAGGIDVFDFTEDGLIREVWSVNGNRAHLI
jgi:SnoaL-like protein